MPPNISFYSLRNFPWEVRPMFVAVLLLLWLIAAAIFISDPKNESNRWFSLIVFWMAVGTIQPVIRDNIIPFWILHHQPETIDVLKSLAASCYILAQLFAPYCILMLCFTQTDNVKWLKYKKQLALISLIPILLLLAYYFTSPNVIIMSPGRPLPANAILWHVLMVLWVIPYIVLANYFLINAYLTARNMRLKQERLQLLLTVMPSFIMAAYLYYAAPLTGFLYEIQYRLIFQLYIAVIFGYFAVRTLILNLKIFINNQQLANTMRATFSGTNMLNHVIKNEVLKIDICINNLIHYSQIGNPTVNELLQTIQASNTHLLALVNRVHNHIQDVTLEESPADLLNLVDQAMKMVSPQLDAKKIKVTKDYCLKTVRLVCDPVHIRELLRNIALNAIEAMKTGGQLHVQIYQKNKRVILAVTDNGTGIAKKDLPHIMKPFFSTKNRQQNSGLGLTYCYNVMQKHGGTLEIFSIKDIGTTVFLQFPESKVLSTKMLLVNTRSDQLSSQYPDL
jgi:signal transduction histidine kinase